MAVDPAKADAVIATFHQEKTLCAASIGRISTGGPSAM
jgi:hypothetical protein